MKRILITLSIAIASHLSYAQNYFPTPMGNVGIGVSMPSALLAVGSSTSQFQINTLGQATSSAPNFLVGTYAGPSSSVFTVKNQSTTLSFGIEGIIPGGLASGTLQYSAYIGTPSPSKALQFGTNNTARMIIDYNGKVGIGTTNPIEKLDVNGSVVFSPNTSGKNTFTFSTNAADDARLLMKSVNTTKVDIQANGISYLNGGNIGIGTSSPRSLLDINGAMSITNENGLPTSGVGVELSYQASTNNGRIISYDRTSNQYKNFNINDNVYVGGAAGYVGIGSTNPVQKLEVAGNILVTGTNGLILNTSGGGAVDNQTGNLFLQKANGAEFIFRNTSPSYAEYMRIDPLGNVGIGTTGPDQKLTVKGKIHSSEVIVDAMTTVPDYVFESDYKLTGLSEIKAYVDKNHHLPEIPSAKEIEKNGIQLGEMNMKLLKKIEELTLYLIEKDIEVRELQTQLNQIKEKMNTK